MQPKNIHTPQSNEERIPQRVPQHLGNVDTKVPQSESGHGKGTHETTAAGNTEHYPKNQITATRNQHASDTTQYTPTNRDNGTASEHNP
jgi:hypothetical protein